jgi:hypothetical protein
MSTSEPNMNICDYIEYQQIISCNLSNISKIKCTNIDLETGQGQLYTN